MARHISRNTTTLSNALKFKSLGMAGALSLFAGSMLIAGQSAEAATDAGAPAQESAELVSAPAQRADLEGPVLVSSNTRVANDVLSKGSAQITVEARITDQTGVSTPTVILSHVGTSQSQGFGNMTLVSGTAKDGIWRRNMSIPPTAAPGEWMVVLYPLTDLLGNSNHGFQTLDVVTVYEGELTAPSVSLSGIARVGEAISITGGQTEDFTPSASGLEYKWLRNGTVIAGATERTYRATPEDLGQEISAAVTGVKPGYKPATAFASPVRIGEGEIQPGTVAIQGDVRVGSTVTAIDTDWVPSGLSLSYQWLRDGQELLGATEQAYTPVPADLGADLSVVLSATHNGYAPISKSSDPKKVLEGKSVAGEISIEGTPRVGFTVTAAVTDWIPADSSLTYQWLRDGKVIAGANQDSYRLMEADAGSELSVRVTGVALAYEAVSATSAAVVVVPEKIDVNVSRLAGENRYETNYRVNAKQMKPGKPLFVATGRAFPDALTVGPAVSLTGGTLVLAPPKGFASNDKTLQLIRNRKPSTVYIIGGKGAVSDTVAQQISSAAGISYQRIGGSNRYETSGQIFEQFFQDRAVNAAFVATGADYPDALSAAAAGGALDMPVLLVPGKNMNGQLQASSIALLKAKNADALMIVGGEAVITSQVVKNLQGEGNFKTSRLSGPDRYRTNAQVNDFVNEKVEQPGTITGLWIATGKNFPDALSAGGPAGNAGQRLVLSNGSCIPKPVVSSWIDGKNSWVEEVNLVGGSGVLKPSVEALTECK